MDHTTTRTPRTRAIASLKKWRAPALGKEFPVKFGNILKIIFYRCQLRIVVYFYIFLWPQILLLLLLLLRTLMFTVALSRKRCRATYNKHRTVTCWQWHGLDISNITLLWHTWTTKQQKTCLYERDLLYILLKLLHSWVIWSVTS